MLLASAPSMGVPKGPMRVPLELGAKLMCRWRGEEYKSCEIIERKQKSLPDGTTDPSGEWEYCADSTAS